MIRRAPTAGFTLIELLVAIGVVVILAAMLTAVGTLARTTALTNKTTNRMTGIITSLGQYASAAPNQAYALQRIVFNDVTDIPSTTWIGTPSNIGNLKVYNFAGAFNQDNAHRDGWWWQKPFNRRGEPLATLGVTGAPSYGTSGAIAGEMLLYRFCTLRSMELLQAAGVLDPDTVTAKANYAIRGGDKEWNDAWGNPLCVSFAMYQPIPASLASSQAKFGYNRSVYLSIAAGGGEALNFTSLPSAWSSTLCKPDTTSVPSAVTTPSSTGFITVPGLVWVQANAICNSTSADGAGLPTSGELYSSDPWEGVKFARGRNGWRGRIGLLHKAVEFK